MVSSTPRPHFTPGKEPVPILQEAGWAPGPVWTGRKSRPHRDSIPDRPARSSVAIPTELPGPRKNNVQLSNPQTMRLRSARWMPRHTLRICNTCCLSTVTMVSRTRLNVALFLHCLSCFFCGRRWRDATVTLYLVKPAKKSAT